MKNQPTTIFDLLDSLAASDGEQEARLREALENDESELRQFWQHAITLVREFGGPPTIELNGLEQTSSLALAGDADAQYDIGLHFLQGRLLVPDASKAVSWFERAVESGHPYAMYQLSFLAMQGNGMEQDTDRAISLLEAAREAYALDSSNSVEVANCLNLLGMNYRHRYEFDKAKATFEKALTIITSLGESAIDLLATITTNLGLLNLDVGDLESAEIQLRSATRLLRELPPATHQLDYMTALDHLAECLARMERFEEAETTYLLAIQMRESALGNRHPSYAASLTGLGWLFMNQGLTDEAESEFQKVVAVFEETVGVDLGRAYCNLGAAQRRLGRLLDAAQTLQHSFELLSQDARPHEVATAMGLLGGTLRQLGNLNAALPLLENALVIHRDTLNRSHGDYGSILNSLGQTYRILGRYHEAEALHQEELQFQLQRFDGNHRSLRVTYSGLGALMGAMGRYDESLEWSNKILELEGGRGVDFAKAINNIATVQLQLGNFEMAEQGYSEAIDIIASLGQAEPHPDLAVYLVNRGILFMETNRPEQAIELFQAAREVAAATAGVDSPHVAACDMNIAVAQAELDKSMDLVGVFQSIAEFFREKLGEADERYLISQKNAVVSQGLSNLVESVRDLANTYGKIFGEHSRVFRSIADPQKLSLTDLSFALSSG